MSESFQTLAWRGDPETGACEIIDQTLLPLRVERQAIQDIATMHAAIGRLAVRGAPAIGIAGAYGLWLGARTLDSKDPDGFLHGLEGLKRYLDSARPTAVNLAWATRRVQAAVEGLRAAGLGAMRRGMFEEVRRIHEEDRAICRRLGEVGVELVPQGARLLTHCNAGGLATSEWGTALAVFFEAHRRGLGICAYADETRPLLQGARLTAWELSRAGIETTLLCDSAAASLFAARRVDAVFVGADRIARNGDVCNKIGTYGVAVLARAHDVPFYVVAPTSTFDLKLAHGGLIPIEERAPEEVTEGFGVRTAPAGIAVWNPAFDVTPAHLVSAIVTEHGLIRPVNETEVRAVTGRGGNEVSSAQRAGR